MKKFKLLAIILIGILVLPFSVFADEKEARGEDIEAISSSTKVNVYLFYGDGCNFCAEMEKFFAGLDNDYKDLINLKGFEVWYSEANADLMQAVAGHLGEDVSGVPFLVIGDKTFNGYSSDMDDEIKTAIRVEYDADERYTDIEDIINEHPDAVVSDFSEVENTTQESKTNSSDIIITIVSILIIAGVVTLIVFARKK